MLIRSSVCPSGIRLLKSIVASTLQLCFKAGRHASELPSESDAVADAKSLKTNRISGSSGLAGGKG